MARLLVVDDNPMMRTVMRAALERAGHEVVLAENGVRALEIGGGPFDLVVTDIEMPHMDGIDLVETIRERSPTAKILVISGRVSGPTLKGMTSEKSLAATAALEKPFTADRLVSKVDEILGQTIAGEPRPKSR